MSVVVVWVFGLSSVSPSTSLFLNVTELTHSLTHILVLGYKADNGFILVTFIYSVSLYLSFLSLRPRSKYIMQCTDFRSQHPLFGVRLKQLQVFFKASHILTCTCEQKVCKESWKIPNHLVAVFFSCSND
jgi:hypothetical protein